ncbi:MAG TPA: transaldolase family protein [Gammaproteobacteria bacterium]|nr:transaldolase family protein [Gammaproteobacteria bacterium]
MIENPVRRLNAFGQSPWLDYLSRDLVRSGELGRLIERWRLGGATTNPAIFEKAIAHTGDRLLAEGIEKFVRPFDATIRAIEKLCTE